MSIAQTPSRQLSTNGVGLWSGQSAASLSFFWKYTGDPALANSSIFGIRFGAPLSVSLGTFTSTSVRLTATMVPATGSNVNLQTNLGVNLTHHVAAVWTAGAQYLYIDGVLAATASRAGPTTTSTQVFNFGSGSANPTCTWTCSDLNIWHGYALSLAEVKAIRDATNPTTIGTSASLRVRYTLAGTTGSTVAIGNPGVANSYGDTTYDFKTVANGTPAGTLTYAAPLVFSRIVVPSDATVLTSGTALRFRFKTTTGTLVVPTSTLATPVVKKNGTTIGPLERLYLTGYHNNAIWFLPPGQSISPTDTVTYTVADDWMGTADGFSAGVTNAPVTNCAGKSAFGTDDIAKTMKPGMNFPWGEQNYILYSVAKNFAKRAGGFQNVTMNRDGTNIAMAFTVASSSIVLWSSQSGLELNDMSPQPEGNYLIGWDDEDTVGNPFTLSLTMSGGTSVAVTSVENFGVSGGTGITRGRARVYTVTRTPGGSSTLSIQINCTNKHPKIKNMVVYPPGSFTFTAGTPVVVDKSDTLALDPVMFRNFPSGLGNVRAIDSMWGTGGIGAGEYEPEDIRYESDFLWGGAIPAMARTFGYTTIRPWDSSVTPYIYSSLFGTPYQATLGAAITDLGTIDPTDGALKSTITITDAATAPVLVGLQLKIGSENMRVLAVNGTSITVGRGSRSTAVATHTTGVGTAGSVTVMNRQAATLTTASFYNGTRAFELVTSTPHQVRSGMNIGLSSGSPNPWPDMTFSDASRWNLSNYTVVAHVTGPNTLLILTETTNFVKSAPCTITSSFTVSPTAATTTVSKPDGGYPIEQICRVAKDMGGDMEINIPMAAGDDLVDAIARRIRDSSFPAGRRIWVEFMNEPWNTAIPYGSCWVWTRMVSTILHGSSTINHAWVCDRSDAIWQRFRDRFNEGGRNRGGEICGIINNIGVAFSTTGPILDYCGSNGIVPYAMAIACYIDTDGSTATQLAMNQGTDAEAIDLAVNNMYENTGTGSGAINYWLRGSMQQVQNYNATYGKDCKFYGYEGSPERIAPERRLDLAANVTATDSIIQLSSSTYVAANELLVGMPMLIIQGDNGDYGMSPPFNTTAEWVKITGLPGGNQIQVSRGMFGTTAQAHTAGVQEIRTAWYERNRDLVYHPNWRIIEKDIYGLWQSVGYETVNIYGYVHPWPKGDAWGMYGSAVQPPGKGDGSDGKANNRLCLAVPGQANSRVAGTNQDATNVSVRGQALIEWTAAIGGPSSPPTVTSQSPSPGATGVVVSSNVNATFSDDMLASSITSSSFTLKGPTGVAIPASVSYNATTRTAVLVPTSSLGFNQTYVATLTTAIQDAGGTHLASIVTWSFTTQSAPDTTPPTVTSQSPASGATGVGINSLVAAGFSEAVTGVVFSLTLAGSPVSASVSYNSSTRTSTLTPTAFLNYASTYTATVSGASDASGNVMSPVTWSFTTAAAPDTTAPTISARTPASGATGVSINVAPTATFSESIVTGSASLALTLAGAPVAGLMTYNTSTRVLTFTPNASLAYSSTYTATVSGATDPSGNVMTPASWTFTTVVDPTPPTVTARSPASGATGVAITVAPSVTFSESVTSIAFTLKLVGATVASTVAYNSTTRVATLTPSSALANSSTYTLAVSGATDVDGNVMAPISWTFTTTGATDITPPTVTSQTPAPGETNVPLNAVPTAVFSEAVTPGSIAFTLKLAGVTVPGTVAYNSSTFVVTFTPTSSLGYGSTYTASLTGAADPSGNVMAPLTWTFTTPTAPVSLVPTSGGIRQGGARGGGIAIYRPSASGGEALGGVRNKSATLVYRPSASGGERLGARATVTTNTFLAAASGGMRLGGDRRTAARYTFVVTASGGERLGGDRRTAATATFVATASGGERFGGRHSRVSLVGYNIYANDGHGGPVNFAAPIASVTDTQYTTSPLPFPGVYTWQVRAYYIDNGLEEHNATARVTVTLDGSGDDVTARPAAPTSLAATPLKGGKIRLVWFYSTPPGRGKPSEFRVYGGTPTVSYSVPIATKTYSVDGRYYIDISGLTNGAVYQFVVRAKNSVGEEPNTYIASATAKATGPRPPDGLTATGE